VPSCPSFSSLSDSKFSLSPSSEPSSSLSSILFRSTFCGSLVACGSSSILCFFLSPMTRRHRNHRNRVGRKA
jgi:hypothetical protein